MLGKQIGIVRNIDFLGRITIPKEIVQTLEMKGSYYNFSRYKEGVKIVACEGGKRLDELSRFVIPIPLRRELKWAGGTHGNGTKLEMFFYSDGLYLREYKNNIN